MSDNPYAGTDQETYWAQGYEVGLNDPGASPVVPDGLDEGATDVFLQGVEVGRSESVVPVNEGAAEVPFEPGVQIVSEVDFTSDVPPSAHTPGAAPEELSLKALIAAGLVGATLGVVKQVLNGVAVGVAVGELFSVKGLALAARGALRFNVAAALFQIVFLTEELPDPDPALQHLLDEATPTPVSPEAARAVAVCTSAHPELPLGHNGWVGPVRFDTNDPAYALYQAVADAHAHGGGAYAIGWRPDSAGGHGKIVFGEVSIN